MRDCPQAKEFARETREKNAKFKRKIFSFLASFRVFRGQSSGFFSCFFSGFW